jgi:hypothetical protein
MQFINPDVLQAGKGLSAGAAAFFIIVGCLLWLVGWRWHRFWIVFGLTMISGVIGLALGEAAGGQQVMVLGVLLAVSAGMLALELAKILSFMTGGIAAWVVAQMVFPQAQELWAIFLAGGLLGVVLYRLWTMLTTSFLGVLISWHGLLMMMDVVMPYDYASWVNKNTNALNGAVLVVMLLGVLIQTRTAGMESGLQEVKAEEPAKPEKKSKKKQVEQEEKHAA